MAKVIHYYQLKDSSQVILLTRKLENLMSTTKLEPEVKVACKRIIEKAQLGRYVILDGTYKTDSGIGMTEFTIRNASVWFGTPKSYINCNRDLFIDNLWPCEVQESYRSLLEIIKSTLIFKTQNSNKNGKDQDQLQGEENSDSRSYEGGILHCRRDRPQLTAGRHCDQAGVEVKEERTGGSNFHLSTRRPEVLESNLRDRIPRIRTQEGGKSSGVTRLQSDGSRVASVGFPIPYGCTLRFCESKESCSVVGDFYKSKGLFYVVTHIDTDKLQPVFERMV